MRPDCRVAWAWLAVLAALGHTTAYTDTEDFLSDLDKPGEFVNKLNLEKSLLFWLFY